MRGVYNNNLPFWGIDTPDAPNVFDDIFFRFVLRGVGNLQLRWFDKNSELLWASPIVAVDTEEFQTYDFRVTNTEISGELERCYLQNGEWCATNYRMPLQLQFTSLGNFTLDIDGAFIALDTTEEVNPITEETGLSYSPDVTQPQNCDTFNLVCHIGNFIGGTLIAFFSFNFNTSNIDDFITLIENKAPFAYGLIAIENLSNLSYPEEQTIATSYDLSFVPILSGITYTMPEGLVGFFTVLKNFVILLLWTYFVIYLFGTSRRII